MDQDMILLLATITTGTLIYFIPYMVASQRKKQNVVAIGMLNLFLGWSIVGWVVALVWAASKDSVPPPRATKSEFSEDIVVRQSGFTQPAPKPNQKKCPDCAEMVLSNARKCRFCGYEFGPAVSVNPE
jgi:hypothetical protein